MYLKNSIVVIALLVTSCALEVKQDKPLEVQDVNVTVEHKFEFDLKQVEGYFLALCQQNSTIPNTHLSYEQEMDICAKAKTAEFMEALISLSNTGT